MKSTLRSLKNEIKKYDEGQRLVREITANTDDVPKMSQLSDLTNFCRNDMKSTPTYDLLWQRLTDYKKLRHVEKALLVVQHLINHGTKKFIRICLTRKAEFEKLTKYVYKVDGSDIGQNVRIRAKECAKLLQRDDIINKTTLYNYADEAQPVSTSQAAAPASYDDYFKSFDSLDADNVRKKRDEERATQEEKERKERQERERKAKENEKETLKPKKKKKSKKKKSSKKLGQIEKVNSGNMLTTQDTLMSNGSDDMDATSDPFDGTDFNDPFFSDDKPSTNSNEQTDDPFATTEDDPFASPAQPEAQSMVKPKPKPKPTPKAQIKVQKQPNFGKITSVSEPEENGGDDLLDFLSASPSPGNNTNTSSNGNANNDTFGAFGSTSYNANNGNVFAAAPANNGYSAPNNNGFGNTGNAFNSNNNGFANYGQPSVQSDPFASAFANNNSAMNNGFGNNNMGGMNTFGNNSGGNLHGYGNTNMGNMNGYGNPSGFAGNNNAFAANNTQQSNTAVDNPFKSFGNPQPNDMFSSAATNGMNGMNGTNGMNNNNSINSIDPFAALGF